MSLMRAVVWSTPHGHVDRELSMNKRLIIIGEWLMVLMAELGIWLMGLNVMKRTRAMNSVHLMLLRLREFRGFSIRVGIRVGISRAELVRRTVNSRRITHIGLLSIRMFPMRTLVLLRIEWVSFRLHTLHSCNSHIVHCGV